MTTPALSSENVSALIEQILTNKDPAVVGLRRILKNKLDDNLDFPVKSEILEDFGAAKGGAVHFSETERHALTQEKKVNDLKIEIEAQKQRTQKAIQAGYEKGFQEGLLRGKKEGEQKASTDFTRRLTTMEDRLAAITKEVDKSKKAIYSNAQHELLRLSLLLARKVINQEIATQPDLILSVIRKVFTYLSGREQVVLRVSPDDFETVTGKKEFWATMSQRLEGIRIEQDKRIGRGGCIIESTSGVADAQVDTQLDSLKDVLDQAWNDLLAAPGKPETNAPGSPVQTKEKST
jgi:flagellar assembly protein FliH